MTSICACRPASSFWYRIIGLPESLLLLEETLAPILVQSLRWKRSRTCQTRQHDLRRQCRLLLLQHGSALLKYAPLLFHALQKRKEGLYLHFEFHPFTPQKFPPVLLNSSRPLSILGVSMIVSLLMLMGIGCVLLIAHQGFPSFFLLRSSRRVQHERRPIYPSSELSGLSTSFHVFFSSYDEP